MQNVVAGNVPINFRNFAFIGYALHKPIMKQIITGKLRQLIKLTIIGAVISNATINVMFQWLVNNAASPLEPESTELPMAWNAVSLV